MYNYKNFINYKVYIRPSLYTVCFEIEYLIVILLLYGIMINTDLCTVNIFYQKAN